MTIPAALVARTQVLIQWIDARSLRERVMLFATMLIVVVTASVFGVFKPLQHQFAEVSEELKNKNAELGQLQAQATDLVRELSLDPNAANQARFDALSQQLREADAPLAAMMNGLVSPKEMTQLVQTLLSQNNKLRVVKMENLAPSMIQEEQDADEPTLPIYKHGLRIDVAGGYRDIVGFLMNLESLPWRVLWDEVNVHTEKYPVSSASVVVYTLSMDQAWIGI